MADPENINVVNVVIPACRMLYLFIDIFITEVRSTTINQNKNVYFQFYFNFVPNLSSCCAYAEIY